MKFASWNLARRDGGVAALVEHLNPDIAFLQECKRPELLEVTGAMPWVPDWRDFFVPLPGTVVLYGCYKNSEVKNGKFRIGQFIQAVPNLKTKHATVHADLFSED